MKVTSKEGYKSIVIEGDAWNVSRAFGKSRNNSPLEYQNKYEGHFVFS